MRESSDLPVQRLAPGPGTPVVLLPGTASGQAVYDGLRPHLGGERELVGVDLPGFGRSAPLPQPDPPTVEALTDAVAAALADDRLGPDRPGGPPHVVGNSLGGAVALELLRRGAAASAVLVSPLGFQRPWEARSAALLLRGVHALATVLAPRADAVLGTPLGRALVLAPVAGRPWRGDGPSAAQMLRDAARTPQMRRSVEATAGWPAPRLAGPEAPVLVLWGSRDAVLYPWQARRVPAALPDARVVLLPGCGHVPFADDPERVAAEVLAFLARVEGAAEEVAGSGGGRDVGPAA